MRVEPHTRARIKRGVAHMGVLQGLPVLGRMGGERRGYAHKVVHPSCRVELMSKSPPMGG